LYLNVHFSAPTCFGPLGPSSGSVHQNLAKVTKMAVSLKYQLKYFVKILAATTAQHHTPKLSCTTPQEF
jgi:hypothetical protein